MNKDNKELFNKDVARNISEVDIILAPPMELVYEANEIAQITTEDEKFSFALQYDANQKDFLLSMLETVGAVVEDDDEERNMLFSMMNMTQLAFVKRLDCIERVKTDEGINPYIEEDVKLTSAQHNQIERAVHDDEVQDGNETLEVHSNFARSLSTVANIETSGVAVTSVTSAARSASCPCPSNDSMRTATIISDESYTSGCICCPGAEQWFKFIATRTGRYTICTTGNLDTIGTLYDCYGNQIVEVDDYAPCGKINFRIIRNLTAGNTYYVKVRIYGNDTGCYTLRVTERVFANYVTINKNTITLEKGVTYELPITPNYTYKGYNGAQRISGLSVSINPSGANEQKIFWWEQYGDVLDCSYGWDDDGDRYIHVTATEIGTAKLYAQDWNENGKRDECVVYVPKKVTVLSCSPSGWVESSEIMGRDMATAFNNEESYVVKTPTNVSSFETCWNEAGECIIVHTQGSSVGLYDHGTGSTPIIVSKINIANLPVNNSIRFIMMTACETAGETANDNVAYWLSKRINPDGIVIANTDIVSGGSTSFRGSNNGPTWKVYKNGIVQNPVSDVSLTMQKAYDIYSTY